ncbi:MAG: hypothetical protein H6925_04865 [Holosporaceae bacterium]|nr:MAG: hypothetical protein H6925_04865 [Holosporaceae bacterium]
MWGVVPGVGMQLNMHNDWRCQIDATYAMYDLSREVSGSANIASYSYHLHMRPRVFGLTIGFSRFF